MRMLVLLITLTLLGCDNVDPADIALVERDAIATIAVPGTPLTAVKTGLEAKGYKCSISSGNFVSSMGQAQSAPSFTRCVKKTEALVGCSIRVEMVVLSEGERLSQGHFSGGNKCI